MHAPPDMHVTPGMHAAPAQLPVQAPARTLPLGPDDLVTLGKPDQPEDHGFARPV
jgi:hypothetical protein